MALLHKPTVVHAGHPSITCQHREFTPYQVQPAVDTREFHDGNKSLRQPLDRTTASTPQGVSSLPAPPTATKPQMRRPYNDVRGDRHLVGRPRRPGVLRGVRRPDVTPASGAGRGRYRDFRRPQDASQEGQRTGAFCECGGVHVQVRRACFRHQTLAVVVLQAV